MNIAQLYEIVSSKYVFHRDTYPALKDINAGEPSHRAFALNHALLHTMKQVGKLATIAEAFDHTNAFDDNAKAMIREASAKLIVNAIQFAAHFDIDPTNLEAAIKESLS